MATVGITDFAQGELGDIIYLEMPETGTQVAAGNPFGTVEAVKTVADLFAPVSGTVVEVNDLLNDSPEMVNRDPYGEGWIIRIELSDASERDRLLDAKEYGGIIH